MDLKPFVGKQVFVQLKGLNFIQVTATEGKPGPLITETQDAEGRKMPQVAMAPMLFGTVEESDRFSQFFIVSPDPNPRVRGQIRTAIAPDVIAFVSEVVEPSRIIPA